MRTARATPSQLVRPIERAAAMRLLNRLHRMGFRPIDGTPSLRRVSTGHCHIVSDRSGFGTDHTGSTWYTIAILRLTHITGRGLQFEERVYSITD